MESLNVSPIAVEKSNESLPPSFGGFSSNHLVVQFFVLMLKVSSERTSSQSYPM